MTSAEHSAQEAKPSSARQEKIDALKALTAGRMEMTDKVAEVTAVLKDLKKQEDFRLPQDLIFPMNMTID